ncbi:GNAT family N-acetyltransferase [Streptomyces beihaiensis]|uniref:GNAT family N-acetyltransferase n=1 Tax=Streptomyces beihaiensis TaxID=2984495 RepID=A0ABT3TT30_9ACTN|nr:GNAT family N-acetyltransferase [Streptomyces beihaiensis]MCX3060200.1 GNAT family N-acetyltransferase [Streptomyces beihaiensis]
MSGGTGGAAVVVRAIRPQEHKLLGELTAAAYLHGGLLTFGENDWYADELRNVEERAAKAEVLVAEGQDGAVVGGLTYVPTHEHPYAEVARPGEAEFRMLAVAPKARGQGAGEALVRAVLDRARETGSTGIALSTPPVATSAHRLYERLGFTRAPERDWAPIPEVTLMVYVFRFAEAAD